MLGAGHAHAGSPAGIGEPEEAAEPPTVPGGCRFLDPVTRSYEHDSLTRTLRQMPALRQRVLIAVRTALESAGARTSLGIRPPGRMGNAFDAEQRQAVRRALRHLTDNGEMVVTDILIRTGRGGRAETTIVYDDPNGDADEVTI